MHQLPRWKDGMHRHTTKLIKNHKARAIEIRYTAALPMPQATVLLGAYRWDAASKRSGTLRKVLGMPPQWFLRLVRKQLSSGFRARAFAAASLVDPRMSKVLEYADAVSGNNAFHVVQPFYRSSANQTITVPELLQFDTVEGDKKTGKEGRRGGCVRVYFVTGQEDLLAPPDGARLLSNALPQTSVLLETRGRK